MVMEPIDLTGGKSVYCFNRQQLDRAAALFKEDSPSGQRIREAVARLETECTRNEQATVAFIVIDRLNQSD